MLTKAFHTEKDKFLYNKKSGCIKSLELLYFICPYNALAEAEICL